MSQPTIKLKGAREPMKEAIEMVPASAPAPAPNMIKVSKRLATALRIGIEQANAAHAAVQAAEERLRQAKQALQAIAGTNQGYLAALIEDAGFKFVDFANFGVWEDAGESYIRAAPARADVALA